MRFPRGRPKARCSLVREALSARQDNEAPLLPAERVAAHLAACQSCREFDAAVTALGTGTGLRLPRPVPAGLVARLEADLVSAGSVPWRRRAGVAVSSVFDRCRPALRWSAVAVPLAAVAVAVPAVLGATGHGVTAEDRPPAMCSPAVLLWVQKRSGEAVDGGISAGTGAVSGWGAPASPR